jgi:hypothetical protein
MKLSEYIKSLQDFLKENGDMNCFYAIDDEGNGYQQVNYGGTLFYTENPDEYRPELYQEDDFEYIIEHGYVEEKEDLVTVCIIN